MKILLLSGGSGKRLWPLSNGIRSKQYIKLLKNERGIHESMIQRMFRQLDELGLLPSTYVVTCQSQVDMIKNQLGEKMNLIIEPCQRGTFPAISLATLFLHSQVQVDANEMVCVVPVDLFVDLSFFQYLIQLSTGVVLSKAELGLIGITPKHPSNQFGYILPKKEDKDTYYSIAQFIEKPDCETAQALINQNALWNSGVFVFSIQSLLTILQEKGLPTEYSTLLSMYDQLPINSFDKEIVEKSDHAIVIPFKGTWKDLGSWNSFSSQLEDTIIGIGEIIGTNLNTHIINELPIPIQVIGISDSMVVASPDGILIAKKDDSDKIKELLDNHFPKFNDKNYDIIRHSITWEDAKKLIQEDEV